jgi:hypothetical protein
MDDVAASWYEPEFGYVLADTNYETKPIRVIPISQKSQSFRQNSLQYM